MAMLAAMDLVGNPSSVHRHGRAARQLLEQARRDVAALVGVPAAQIVFTSGATEANNLALAAAHDGACAISAVEHESIIGAASPATTLIAVDRDGVINADALADVLATSPQPVSNNRWRTSRLPPIRPGRCFTAIWCNWRASSRLTAQASI
jgi:cysteine desulfurase